MTKQYDITIIGGGIMGMMTAYYASFTSKNVCLIEKNLINNDKSSSFGFTRSYRNDYPDPFYANLANESNNLWKQIEKDTKSKLLINCGVLNIAKSQITPDFEKTYATISYKVIKKLNIPTRKYSKAILKRDFPQFNADFATLDIDAGLIDVNETFSLIKSEIKKRGVEILENTQVTKLSNKDTIILELNNEEVINTNHLVVTAGVWTNLILKSLLNYRIYKIPVVPVKQIVKYYQVPKKLVKQFSYQQMPVFAYLDVGIYGHPIFRSAPGIKVAYFDPYGAKFSKTGLNATEQKVITDQESFIKTCLNGIDSPKMIKKTSGYYQMTPDNNFIIGKLSGLKNIYIATGFCGTGLKFAPLVGKILTDLALRKSTIYKIERFSPKRFSGLNKYSIKTISKMVKYLSPANWPFLKLGISRLTYNKIK